MALKYNKPRSSGKKTYVRVNYKKQLTTKKPLKSLTSWNHNVSGRNFQGKITIRHHGGGHKQKLREIDFKRNKDNIMATIKTIEYNPNRSSFISLVAYQDGVKKYILTPNNVKVGQKIISGKKVEVKIGNYMEIQKIPEGTFIHNVELNKGHGGQLILQLEQLHKF